MPVQDGQRVYPDYPPKTDPFVNADLFEVTKYIGGANYQTQRYTWQDLISELSPTFSPTWGSISGLLSNQTDLNTALNARELVANKAINFSTVNNTLYPTTQAVVTYTGIFELLSNKATDFSTSNNTLYPTTQAVTNSFFKQGGNSFGSTATIGTNDANGLILKTNNTFTLQLRDTDQAARFFGDMTADGKLGVGRNFNQLYTDTLISAKAIDTDATHYAIQLKNSGNTTNYFSITNRGKASFYADTGTGTNEVLNIGSSTLSGIIKVLENGNVGIGATPDYKLHVNGNAVFTGGTVAGLALGNSGSSYSAIGYNALFTGTGNLYQYRLADTSSLIQFQDGGFLFKATPTTGTPGGNINFDIISGFTNTGKFVVNGAPNTAYKAYLTVFGIGTATTTLGDSVIAAVRDIRGSVGNRVELGIGYGNTSPNVIGHVVSDNTSFTKGDFYIVTRDVTTNTAPTDYLFYGKSNGDVAIGHNAPLSRLHIKSTSQHLRLEYDASNYMYMFVNSTGGVGFAAVGSVPFFAFSTDVLALTIQTNNPVGFPGTAKKMKFGDAIAVTNAGLLALGIDYQQRIDIDGTIYYAMLSTIQQ